ncbi:MAG: ABC transporter permease [Parabacteroides sp.]
MEKGVLLKQYCKQAMQQFRENPLVTALSVAGTALAVAVILVMVLVFQINLAGFAPESHRDRFLYVLGAEASSRSGGERNRGYMSAEVLKECFYTLKTPEAVCGYALDNRSVSLPEKRLSREYAFRWTDAGYWQIFDHTFVEGAPFTQADFEAGIRKVVLSEETARKLFGNESAVGREVVIEFKSYRVCGVVKEVPNPLMVSYGQVFAPYTCNVNLMTPSTYGENIPGQFCACMLARSSADFEAIRQELQGQVERYNKGKRDADLSFPAGAVTQLDTAMGSNNFYKVDWKNYLVDKGLFLLFLLVIPALNLIGVIQSSLQKRIEEIGMRRAFGATRWDIVSQVLSENMVMTLIGAVIGIVLSIGLLFVARSFLFNAEVRLTVPMLIRPGLFMAAFVLALLLNLLSAMIPAWHTMRKPIVDAIHGSESEKK